LWSLESSFLLLISPLFKYLLLFIELSLRYLFDPHGSLILFFFHLLNFRFFTHWLRLRLYQLLVNELFSTFLIDFSVWFLEVFSRSELSLVYIFRELSRKLLSLLENFFSKYFFMTFVLLGFIKVLSGGGCLGLLSGTFFHFLLFMEELRLKLGLLFFII
jgi:hypothetical protein